MQLGSKERMRDCLFPGAPDVAAANVLSLCTGIGGLDLGVGSVLPTRTVCYVEREYACCQLLAHRMAEGSLDAAPICTDLHGFSGCEWRGSVDLVTCGYPCQPYSNAGAMRGGDDERDLWPEVRRVLREVGPGVVFLENVPGHLRLGFDRVLGDLADLGFDAEWGLVRASDVGAPHRRERLFVLGYTDRARLPRRVRPGVKYSVQGHAWPGGPESDWSKVDEQDWPAIERQLCGETDGLPKRVDRLRALGNAVVPQQAAYAFELLLRRALQPC